MSRYGKPLRKLSPEVLAACRRDVDQIKAVRVLMVANELGEFSMPVRVDSMLEFRPALWKEFGGL